MSKIVCVTCNKRDDIAISYARESGWKLWTGGGMCPSCVIRNRAQTSEQPLRKVVAIDLYEQRRLDVRRRGAMLWMLACAGVPIETLAEITGYSMHSIRQSVAFYRNELELRARGARTSEDPAIKRLRAAGAIPMQQGGWQDHHYVSDAFRRAFHQDAPVPQADWPQRSVPARDDDSNR